MTSAVFHWQILTTVVLIKTDQFGQNSLNSCQSAYGFHQMEFDDPLPASQDRARGSQDLLHRNNQFQEF